MKHNNQQVTISQVAKEAGVSSQTVSRVINNRQEITPETRQHVQEVIKRLGYQPNAIARSLSQRRSHTLGVVASGLEYYGPSHSLIGVEQGANQQGFSILLNLLHQPENENVEQIVNGLISRQVEGIIWAVPEIGNNRAWFRENVPQLAIPVIFLNTQSNKTLHVVEVNNRNGGYMATEHLLARGYQKIGLIAGPLTWWAARERQRGWQEALAAAGVPFSNAQVVVGNWSAESGERGLYELLEKSPDIQAVFACNDQMALGLMRAARRLGKRIPEDLAVVGFDDTPESAFYFPPLTTIRQDLYQLGHVAVQTFVSITEAEQKGEPVIPAQTVWLQPQLVIREST
ncbi:MAG TPA: LacI family DNA-binding transcriptional regulator [Anaerolineales bacterium]|nr:LacI family DNA-binding transcriptional regulator [Anaerolineales bacterium]